ncbi:substrate-binding domain-containing protein, partial [Paenibacillus sepulcri]|nr:substrate-binding domain-containing protein [Paenibacillus sepulcri]
GQIRLVEQAIDWKVDALILAANDYLSLGQATDKAGSAGIPVISIDTEVASTKAKSYIGTDNYAAGRKAGMELIEQTGDNSRVAVVSFVEGARNAVQREEGLLNLLAQYSGVQVVDLRYAQSDIATAEQVTREILQEYGQIDGIVALNAIATIGVMNVVAELGMGEKIKVIGFDSTSEIMEMLQEGVIQSTIVQNPFTMGYLSVKYAVEAADGKKLPERVDSGTVVIDINNMLDEKNQKLLFPFIK